MQRNEWKFTYTAARLAEAALTKFSYHDERISWWSDKRQEVMAKIRSEGIEVDERLVLANPNPKARDWDRGTQVMVRNDLQDDLAECLSKLRHHTGQRRDYDGWVQALQANEQAQFELDIDDYLFFFGRN